MAKDAWDKILDKDDDKEITEILEPEKKKRGRKSGKTKKYTDNEIAKYFCLLFNFISKITQVDYNFTEQDFLLESEMMESISKKFEIVGKGLAFISPFILALALAEKGYIIYTLHKNKKSDNKPEPTINAPIYGNFGGDGT